MIRLALVLIVLTTLTVACDFVSKKPVIEEEQTSTDTLPANEMEESDCPLLKYSRVFEDSIYIKANYYKCESDWNFDVHVLIHNRLVYALDKDIEIEFKENAWPNFKRINANEFLLLLEVNDRPLKNKLLELRLNSSGLISEQTLPHFTTEPLDYDGDGRVEYAGYLDADEWVEGGRIYNPILYYEETSNGFTLDSSLTQRNNRQLWGAFYGFEMKNDLVLPAPDKKKWSEFLNEK